MLILCRVAPQIGKNDTQAGILRLRVGKVTLERAHINYKMTFAKITTAAEQTDLTEICSNINAKSQNLKRCFQPSSALTQKPR